MQARRPLSIPPLPRSLFGSSRQQRLQVLLGAAAAPVLPAAAGGSAWSQLTSNYVFCVGFWGWFIAQFLKVRGEPLSRRCTGTARQHALAGSCPVAEACGFVPLWHVLLAALQQAAARGKVVERQVRSLPPPQIFTKRYKTGVWDLRAFVDSGGMPSSHSSLCSVRLTGCQPAG